MDAWKVFFISIIGLRYTEDRVYVRGTHDWSQLYPELSYDPTSHEIRMPRGFVRKQQNTPFGYGWYFKQKRMIMFLRHDPVHHGYRLCFATRGPILMKRLEACGMTPIWIEPTNN